MKKEKWKDVVGFEGLYRVSNYGRVRSKSRMVYGKGRWGKRWLPIKGKLLNGTPNKKGYPFVKLYKLGEGREGKKTGKAVHQLVLEAFVGPCPKGMQACHGNGKRNDPRLKNLRWDTPKENSKDKIKHGTHQIGDKNGRSKLTVYDVPEIRMLLRTTDLSLNKIAQIYDVNVASIYDLQEGRTWIHVPGWNKKEYRIRKRIKLTPEKVKTIKYLFSTGDFSQTELAGIYDVSQSSIHLIVRNKNWKSVV